MTSYIVTLKWNSGATDTRRIEARDDNDAHAQAERIKVNNKADEVFVEKRKSVISRLLNDADLNMTPLALR